MASAIRGHGCALVSRAVGLMVTVPLAIGAMVLGAVAALGRWTSGFWREETPVPRHHAERVRERARAAGQAARRSGLLSPRDR